MTRKPPKTTKTPRKKKAPSPKGEKGRDTNTGRFQKGYKGGPGNPYAKQVADLRTIIRAAVTPEDMTKITEVLVSMAQAGNIHAIRELFDRLLGKANQPIEQTVDFRGKSMDELRSLIIEDLAGQGLVKDLREDD